MPRPVPATGTARPDPISRGCVRPAGLDAGEITDKGYVNQREVLANRAALVELLYAQPEPESPENPELPAGVVEAERTA